MDPHGLGEVKWTCAFDLKPQGYILISKKQKYTGKSTFTPYIQFYYSKENSFSVKTTRNIQESGNPRMPSKRATKNMLDRGITFDFPIWEGKNTPNPVELQQDDQALCPSIQDIKIHFLFNLQAIRNNSVKVPVQVFEVLFKSRSTYCGL